MCNFFNCKCALFKGKKPGPMLKANGVDRAMVKEAGDELRQAYQILDRADDQDMVDYAVFTLQAAEKRYGYLLKKLKEQEKHGSFMAEGGEI